MELCGETAEAGLDGALVCVEGDGEEAVEIPGALELPVRFVDGVEEVEDYDGDVDRAAVGEVLGAPGGGLAAAGADGEGVVNVLEPVDCLKLGYQYKGARKTRIEELTRPRKNQPAKEIN